MASSATLGDALSRAERYSTINNEGIMVRCSLGGSLCVHLTYVGLARHSDRHQIEFWATALIRIALQLSKATLPAVRVTFAHARCVASTGLENALGDSIEFESAVDTGCFRRGANDLTM